MKTKLYLLIAVFGLILGGTSCDRVKYPYVIITDLDTSLYPGNFIDYDYPTFDANTNTLRNVMIEDYTGHKCPFCPPAAAVAEGIEASNPGRVFVATIHAGASSSGVSDFQKTNATGEFTHDFTTPEGREMAGTFYDLNVGFDSNPKGTINRVQDGGGLFFVSASTWGSKTDEVLATPLDINIQAKSNYFPETNGVFLHTETEFINDMEGNYNIVVYILQNEIIDWQINGTEYIENYQHRNVHLGNMFGETWGRSVGSGSISAGTKVHNDFSYKLPDGLTNDDLHLLIYVYDKATYEVMQVIEHEF